MAAPGDPFCGADHFPRIGGLGSGASDVLVASTKQDYSTPPIPRNTVMIAIERLLPYA